MSEQDGAEEASKNLDASASAGDPDGAAKSGGASDPACAPADAGLS